MFPIRNVLTWRLFSRPKKAAGVFEVEPNDDRFKPMKRRRWLKATVGSLTAGGGLWFGKNSWLSAGPGWRGPITDHFDGGRFFNPGGPKNRGLLDFWRWQFSGGRREWPATAAGLVEPQLPESLGENESAVTFIGHATFLLQTRELNLLTDPVFSHRCSPVSWAGPQRVRPPAISWERLPRIDLVLLSHNHYDHLDIPTLRRLDERDAPLSITGLGNRAFLERRGLRKVVELDWWQPHDVKHARITFVPAVHWSNRGGWGENATLWGGFMIQSGSRKVFFAGDTGFGPHFSEIRQRFGEVDLALLPIGAYEPQWFMRAMHLHPEDAVRAHLELAAKRSVGMHFGTWQLTDEGIDEPVSALKISRAAAGLSEADFAAPRFGETLQM